MASPVRDYAERNPCGGYDAIVIRFGKPGEVVETYLADMEVEELLEHLRIRKRILVILKVTAFVIILLWASFVCIALGEVRSNINYTIVDDVEVVERGLISEGGNE